MERKVQEVGVWETSTERSKDKGTEWKGEHKEKGERDKKGETLSDKDKE